MKIIKWIVAILVVLGIGFAIYNFISSQHFEINSAQVIVILLMYILLS